MAQMTVTQDVRDFNKIICVMKQYLKVFERNTLKMKQLTIHQAVVANRMDIVRTLLHGSKKKLNLKSKRGYTPLMLACFAKRENLDMVTLVLNYEPRLNKVNRKNNTALHLACYAQHIETVRLLLSVGCNFTLRNLEGDNALSIALRIGNVQLVKVLLQFGVIPFREIVRRRLLLCGSFLYSISVHPRRYFEYELRNIPTSMKKKKMRNYSVNITKLDFRLEIRYLQCFQPEMFTGNFLELYYNPLGFGERNDIINCVGFHLMEMAILQQSTLSLEHIRNSSDICFHHFLEDLIFHANSISGMLNDGYSTLNTHSLQLIHQYKLFSVQYFLKYVNDFNLSTFYEELYFCELGCFTSSFYKTLLHCLDYFTLSDSLRYNILRGIRNCEEETSDTVAHIKQKCVDVLVNHPTMKSLVELSRDKVRSLYPTNTYYNIYNLRLPIFIKKLLTFQQKIYTYSMQE